MFRRLGRRVVRSIVGSAIVALCAGVVVPMRVVAQSATQQAAVATPNTPAGRVLKAWLDAFNSGDSAKLAAYLQQYQPDRAAEAEMNFRRSTGGFDLLSIAKSDPTHVEFMVKEKNSPTTAFGFFDVAAGDAPKVTSSSLLALPPGASPSSLTLTIDSA
jgi:hypothetical protein